MADSPNKNNEDQVTDTPPVDDATTTEATNAASPAVVDKRLDPLALRQALDKMRPKFSVFTEAQLISIRLDVPTAAMWVLNRVEDFEPYRPKIAQLPFVNHDLIEHIEPAAMGLLEIDSQSKVAVKLPPEVMETYRDGSLLRDELREEGLILERRKLLPRGSLASVSGDRGYRNTAVDLNALGNMLRDNWPTIEGKTAITIDEVNRCSVLAHQLFRNADDRLQRASIPAHLALLRQQAYTYLLLAYEELRRCLMFIEPTAVERVAPTLFQGRGRKPASSVTEEPLPELLTPQEPDLETQILQELSPPADQDAAVTDPVKRAEAAQAASDAAKASKNPFSG